VAVVEHPGIVESLRRSWALTKGFRWRILGLLLLVGVLGGIVGGIVGGVTAFVPSVARILISSMVNIVVASLAAVVHGVGYHDLRVAAEGLDTEELSAVFD
jgi:hypothetical protein